jgi:hypothetical protein
MSNQESISSLRTKLWSAEQRRKFAWARYYTETQERLVSDTTQYNIMTKIPTSTLPQHIINEIEENTATLRKNIECPVCMTVIEKGKLEISYCGHKYCKDCFKQLDKCAICRKNFKHN